MYRFNEIRKMINKKKFPVVVEVCEESSKSSKKISNNPEQWF